MSYTLYTLLFEVVYSSKMHGKCTKVADRQSVTLSVGIFFDYDN